MPTHTANYLYINSNFKNYYQMPKNNATLENNLTNALKHKLDHPVGRFYRESHVLLITQQLQLLCRHRAKYFYSILVDQPKHLDLNLCDAIHHPQRPFLIIKPIASILLNSVHCSTTIPARFALQYLYPPLHHLHPI